MPRSWQQYTAMESTHAAGGIAIQGVAGLVYEVVFSELAQVYRAYSLKSGVRSVHQGL
jgi:hypothetical protein